MPRERILTDEQIEEILQKKGRKGEEGKLTLKEMAPKYGMTYGSFRIAISEYRKKKNGNVITKAIQPKTNKPPKRKLPVITEVSPDLEKELLEMKKSRNHWYEQTRELEKRNEKLEYRIMRLESQLNESLKLQDLAVGLGLLQIPIPQCLKCGEKEKVVRNGYGRGTKEPLDFRPRRFLCKGCGNRWEKRYEITQKIWGETVFS